MISAALAEHQLLPEVSRSLLIGSIVGVTIVMPVAAGRRSSAEVAAHFTPVQPSTVEGVVRITGFAAVLLVLPGVLDVNPVVFAVVAAVVLRAATEWGNAFGRRDREMGCARDAALEAEMDVAAVERLWLLLTSHPARGVSSPRWGSRR